MTKFIVKWALNGIIVVPLLMFYAGVTFFAAFAAASVLTVIAYLIGDQVIFRNTNNAFALVSDFVLAAVYLGLVSYFYNWFLTVGEVIIISLIVTAAEWVFHRYFLRYNPAQTV